MARQNDPLPFFISQLLAVSPMTEAPRSAPEAIEPPAVDSGAPAAPFWTSAHCQLILFSEDEENYGSPSSSSPREEENKRPTVIRGTEEEESRLREEFLKHHRLFTHTSRVCRTIRRFLERTKHKRRHWTPAGTLEMVDDRLEVVQMHHHHIDSDYYGDDDSDDDSSEELAMELETVRGKASKASVPLRSRPRPQALRCVGGDGGGDYDNDDALEENLSSQLMVDSMNENASNCSWEAVDDRSAPSSGANSSQQMQYSSSGVGTSASVLWVPDHAVTRCTSCQLEFTLCRRKHHCRSCGQIFCAECSEYTAHLPDERFYQPVRLCGPCYQRISTITMATTSNSVGPSVQHQYPSSSSCAASVATTSSMSLANGGGSAFHSQRTLLAGGHPLHSLGTAAECKQQAVNGGAAGSESSRVNDVACCKANATATASN